jgi:hypothetical protein
MRLTIGKQATGESEVFAAEKLKKIFCGKTKIRLVHDKIPMIKPGI